MLGGGLMRLLGFGIAHVVQAVGGLVFALVHLFSRVLWGLLFVGAGFAGVAHRRLLSKLEDVGASRVGANRAQVCRKCLPLTVRAAKRRWSYR